MRSIMQKKNGTCYLCRKLYGDDSKKDIIHEHHAIYGHAQRKLSEIFGLKVYLCLAHHLTGPDAVHKNPKISEMVKADAQRVFTRHYTNFDFMEIFGRNYIYDEPKAEEDDGKGFIWTEGLDDGNE